MDKGTYKAIAVGLIVILTAIGSMQLDDYGKKQFWVGALGACDAEVDANHANFCIVDLIDEKNEFNILTHSELADYQRIKFDKENELTFYKGYFKAATSKLYVDYYKTYGEDEWVNLKRKSTKVDLNYEISYLNQNVKIVKETEYYATKSLSGTGGWLVETFWISQDEHKYMVEWVPHENRENYQHRIRWDISGLDANELDGTSLVSDGFIVNWTDIREEIDEISLEDGTLSMVVEFDGGIVLDPSIGLGYALSDFYIKEIGGSPECLTRCHFIYEFYNPLNTTLPFGQLAESRIIDDKNLFTRSERFIELPVRKENLTSVYHYPEYTTCFDTNSSCDGNSSSKGCCYTRTDYEFLRNDASYYYENEWVPVDSDTYFAPKTVYKVMVVGYKKPALGSQSVDYIPVMDFTNVPKIKDLIKKEKLEWTSKYFWNSSWSYKREVTIDFKQDTNSGLVIDINSGLFDFGACATDGKCMANFADLRIVIESDDSPIDTHYEHANTTDRNSLWFDMNTNQSATDSVTDYELYYGNGSATYADTSDLNFGATDSGTKIMWRFEDDEATTTIRDYNGEGNNVDTNNVNTNTAGFKVRSATGGYGNAFDTSVGVIDIGTTLSGLAAGTIEGFVYDNSNNTAVGHSILSVWADSSHKLYISENAGSTNILRFQTNSWTVDSSFAAPSDEWYHFALTWGGAGVKTCINGKLAGTDASTAALDVIAISAYIGLTNEAGSLKEYFSGYIDEVRISSVQFASCGEIYKTYPSVNQHDIYVVTLGAEESANTNPDTNITHVYPYLSDFSAAWNDTQPLMFGDSRDVNARVRFYAYDTEGDDLNFSMWTGATQSAKTDNVVFDVNLSEDTCLSDTNSSTGTYCTWDFVITDVSDGNIFVTIEVNDGAAADTNSSEFSTGILIDNTAPTTSNLIPVANVYDIVPDFNFEITMSDSNPRGCYYEVLKNSVWEDVAWVDMNSSDICVYTATGVAAGDSVLVQWTATDVVDNNASDANTAEYVRTTLVVPDVNWVSPNVGYFNSTVDINFSYNISDPNEPLSFDLYKSASKGAYTTALFQGFDINTDICDTGTPPTACQITVSLVGQSDANFFFDLNVFSDTNKTFDLNSSESLVFDATAPTIYCDANQSWQNTDANVSTICSDATTDVNTVAVDYNGIGYTFTDSGIDRNSFIETGDGNFTLDFFCTDQAGNETDVNRVYVTVDQNAPYVVNGTISPDANTGTSDSTPPLAFDTNDLWSGFASYSYTIFVDNDDNISANVQTCTPSASNWECAWDCPEILENQTCFADFNVTDILGNTSGTYRTAAWNRLPTIKPSVYFRTPFDGNISKGRVIKFDLNAHTNSIDLSTIDVNLSNPTGSIVLDDFEDNWSDWVAINGDANTPDSNSGTVLSGTYSMELIIDADKAPGYSSGWRNTSIDFDLSPYVGVKRGAPTRGKLSFSLWFDDNNSLNTSAISLEIASNDITNEITYKIDKASTTQGSWKTYDFNMADYNAITGAPDWDNINFMLLTINRDPNDNDMNVLMDDMNVSGEGGVGSPSLDFNAIRFCTALDANYICNYPEFGLDVNAWDYNISVRVADTSGNYSDINQTMFEFIDYDVNITNVIDFYLRNESEMEVIPGGLVDQNVVPLQQNDTNAFYSIKNFGPYALNVYADLNDSLPNDSNVWIKSDHLRGAAYDVNALETLKWGTIAANGDLNNWLWFDLNLHDLSTMYIDFWYRIWYDTS